MKKELKKLSLLMQKRKQKKQKLLQKFWDILQQIKAKFNS
jgi:hypothetical protein